MKKIGRPIMDEHEKRSETLALRLTLAEKTILEKQAANAGISLAAYVRRLMLNARVPTSSGIHDAALLTELNRLGLEFNRVASAGLEGCDPQRLDAVLVKFNETLTHVSRAYGA